jgi:hypothetical protein
MTFKLGDARIGQHVVVVEPIEDEIRWRHYLRQEGQATFRPDYVPVIALRTVQGRLGAKPRYDSGELPTPSEMPGASLVVDAAEVNHDWTEAHDGLLIVTAVGWTGFYVNSRQVHVISPFERPYRGDAAAFAVTVAKAVAEAFDREIAIGFARADALANDLTKMRLKLDAEADNH